MKTKPLLFLALLILLSVNLQAQTSEVIDDRSSFMDRVYVGGNVGFGFGDVTYVQLAPIVGYRITNEWSAGIGIQYQYRKDKRFNPDLEASDYGTSLFTRYNIFDPFFLQAEYEYLNFEFFAADLTTFREDFSSVLIGGGLSQPLGKKAAFNITVLYNLSYDDADPIRPYDSPVIVRAGISLGL